MGFLTDWITDWLKGLLIEGIMGNLEGLFTNVNNRVGEIAVQVGTTPAAWNAGVFSLIRQLSETVVLPIAGIVLTFVMCYELIQMLIDRNNLHDIDTWLFFKWVFKTFVAVTILSNSFNIVMAVFDVAQSVVAQSAGLVQGSTSVTPDMLANLQATLEGMELGPLLGLWLQSFVVQLTMLALNIFIFVIVYGRMIEIYMLTSLAPLPFATVVNREIGHMGHNYFRSLLAVGFQGLLIMVCLAIYAVLIQSIATAGATDIFGVIWTAMGYTVLLCFTLLKTGSLAKSIFGAH
ncbi:MAG: CD0415/CD1112 family protein [Oscillibacter sp.]